MDFEQLCDLLGRISPKKTEIYKSSRLESDLGLCSFDMMELIVMIKEEYGCNIDFAQMKEDICVADLLVAIV